MAYKDEGGIRYFPLLVDYHKDDNIRRLRHKYGNDGVEFYFFLLCRLYKKGYVLKLDEDIFEDAEIDVGVSEEKQRPMVDYMLEKGMFDKRLYQQEGLLSSEAIQIQFQECARVMRRRMRVEPRLWLLPREKTNSCIDFIGEAAGGGASAAGDKAGGAVSAAGERQNSTNFAQNSGTAAQKCVGGTQNCASSAQKCVSGAQNCAEAAQNCVSAAQNCAKKGDIKENKNKQNYTKQNQRADSGGGTAVVFPAQSRPPNTGNSSGRNARWVQTTAQLVDIDELRERVKNI